MTFAGEYQDILTNTCWYSPSVMLSNKNEYHTVEVRISWYSPANVIVTILSSDWYPLVNIKKIE